MVSIPFHRLATVLLVGLVFFPFACRGRPSGMLDFREIQDGNDVPIVDYKNRCLQFFPSNSNLGAHVQFETCDPKIKKMQLWHYDRSKEIIHASHDETLCLRYDPTFEDGMVHLGPCRDVLDDASAYNLMWYRDSHGKSRHTLNKLDPRCKTHPSTLLFTGALDSKLDLDLLPKGKLRSLVDDKCFTAVSCSVYAMDCIPATVAQQFTTFHSAPLPPFLDDGELAPPPPVEPGDEPPPVPAPVPASVFIDLDVNKTLAEIKRIRNKNIQYEAQTGKDECDCKSTNIYEKILADKKARENAIEHHHSLVRGPEHVRRKA